MDKKISRKNFFISLLKEIGKPVASYIEEKLNKITGIIIRPPGAGIEIEFLSKCNRCYLCVKMCPAYAIRVLHLPPDNNDPLIDATPYIKAEEQPCIMCEDMYCIISCKTNALHKLDKITDMKIGVAMIQSNCLRYDGIMCDECINRCPLGKETISLNNKGNVDVNIKTCTGCGICVYNCPQRPRAIQIERIIS